MHTDGRNRGHGLGRDARQRVVAAREAVRLGLLALVALVAQAPLVAGVRLVGDPVADRLAVALEWARVRLKVEGA